MQPVLVIYINLNCIRSLRFKVIQYSVIITFESRKTLQVFQNFLVYFTVN